MRRRKRCADHPQTSPARADIRHAQKCVASKVSDPYLSVLRDRDVEVAPSSLVVLIYELLDAHDDTARMASAVELDTIWRAHIEYLRALQRTGREMLAAIHRGSS